jgi:ketosteroid isomerase-like protein
MAFSGPLEDRIAIRELHDAYADAGFRGDRQGWLDCWSEDCVWKTVFGELRGRAALTKQWDQLWDTIGALGFFAKVGAIEVDGDRAATRCYIREIFLGKDGAMQKIVGRYDDQLARESGGWKFLRRDYTVLIREAS